MSQEERKPFSIGIYFDEPSGKIVLGNVGDDDQGRHSYCSWCGKKIYGNTHEQAINVPMGPIIIQQFYCSTGCFQQRGEEYKKDPDELQLTLMDYLIMAVMELWRWHTEAEAK